MLDVWFSLLLGEGAPKRIIRRSGSSRFFSYQSALSVAGELRGGAFEAEEAPCWHLRPSRSHRRCFCAAWLNKRLVKRNTNKAHPICPPPSPTHLPPTTTLIPPSLPNPISPTLTTYHPHTQPPSPPWPQPPRWARPLPLLHHPPHLPPPEPPASPAAAA